MISRFSRILACMVTSLMVTCFIMGLLVVIGEGYVDLAAIVIFPLMFAMNMLMPSLLSCFILYYLVKKKKEVEGFKTILLVSLQYILWSAAGLVLWAVGETLFSSEISPERFWHIYKREFASWNILLVINGLAIPFLYFDDKFLRPPSGDDVAKTNVSEEA